MDIISKLGKAMSKNEQEIAFNSTYEKLVVQRLNEVLRFVQSFVVADCFVLRNRQLLAMQTVIGKF